MFESLKRENIIAGDDYNRWKVPIVSVAIHMCIGSVYAWSIFNPPLTKALGVVAPSANDWDLGSVVWIFSVAIVCLGLAAAFAGKWLEKVGPKMVGMVAAVLWGGGFIIGYFGIITHQLWLLYLGYGVFGGCGLGLGYVSPVSTLIKWFPDRRGMATGMAIMGFGGGAMIAGPLKKTLLDLFAYAPKSLGDISSLNVETIDGVRYVDGVEVVIDNSIAYVVGSGSTGVAATFLTLGILYFSIMVIAASLYKVPGDGWTPKGWDPSQHKSKKLVTTGNISVDNAMKTPQFYLLWIVLCMNVSAGIGVIGVAKTMITEIFGSSMPTIVDAVFATNYVVMISVFNMVGRFLWASASDYIGRKNTYTIFFVLGIILYMSIPYTAHSVGVNPAVQYLVIFYAATMIIFTMYGGGFATIPAYLADVFGQRQVGAIHGRLLTSWSVAGIVGPLAITKLREISANNALRDLADKISDSAFIEKFGAGKDVLDRLIETKTVTINSLMSLAPPGTVDPTINVYNTTMYTMAALLFIGLVANLFMHPVHEKHHD